MKLVSLIGDFLSVFFVSLLSPSFLLKTEFYPPLYSPSNAVPFHSSQKLRSNSRIIKISLEFQRCWLQVFIRYPSYNLIKVILSSNFKSQVHYRSTFEIRFSSLYKSETHQVIKPQFKVISLPRSSYNL